MTASTWTWIGNTSTTNDSANWSLTSGAGNAKHKPQNGDTAILAGAGTPPQFIDSQFAGATTIDLTATGTVQFLNDTSFASNSSLDPSTLIDASGTATTLQTQGTFTSSGTIEVTGTGNHLAIAIGPAGTLSGSFQNFGTITVDQGDTLTITTVTGGTFASMGTVFVAGGTAVINADMAAPTGPGNNNNSNGAENFSISQGGSLEIQQSGTTAQPAIDFNGTGILKLDQPGSFGAPNIGGGGVIGGIINGFSLGDTIDLGVLNVSSVVFDGQGDFFLIGGGGATVFAAASNIGALNGNNGGTFALSGTGGVAEDVIVTEGGGGDTVLTVAPPRVWLWNGATALVNTPGDWSQIAGPPNGGTNPGPGDTAIVATGTVLGGGQFNLSGNMLELGGTAGAAALSVGGTGGEGGGQPTSFQKPSLDQTSTITSHMTSAGTFVAPTTAESSLLAVAGPFVNEGTIIANGPTGSNFTIALSGTTVNGTFQPGTFINYMNMEVDAGNAMTISVGANSEFYNASEILVNGGSLQFTGAAGAIDGGYAGETGAIVIVGGGTVETNAGYAPNSQSLAPIYAFADSSKGNTLKIDNLGSFGGLILNFGTNDTIDLGTSLAVATIVYSATTGILNLEDSGGTIIDSLGFASGAFKSGTIPVVGGTAGGFTFSQGGDGDTVLTTANPGGDVFNNTSGSWQAAGLWSNGVPGTLDTVLIGFGSQTPFTLTTGTAPVSVGAPILSGSASLQITSATTVGPYAFRQFGGTVEVTAGNTLTETQLTLFGGADTIDPGATLDLTGHVVFGTTGAINGTIAASGQGTRAVSMSGGTLLVNGGVLDAAPGQAGGNGGSFYLGVDGGGTPATAMVQSNGASAGVVTVASTFIGSDPTSFGSLTLNGGGVAGGATWTDSIDASQAALETTGFLEVGFNNQASLYGTVTPPALAGAATLVVENLATLTVQSYAIIGLSHDSAGTVQIAGGLWNVGTGVDGGFITVGDSASSTGSLEVDGGGTVSLAQGGTFFSNGTTFTGSGINVGLSAGSAGTVTVQNGGLITDGAGLAVGSGGQGVAQVLNGGTINLTGTNGTSVGLSATSVGTLLVQGQSNGISALLDLGPLAKGISVGEAGRGTVDVESGGTITLSGTGGIAVGQSLGAYGLLIVNGPNAAITQGTASGGLGVGNAGTGTVEVENGGLITLNGTSGASGIGIGQTAGAIGLVTVSGANSRIAVTGPSGGINVGTSGQGTLQVLSGGSVSINANGLGIANGSGTGVVDVSGLGSSLSTHGGIGVGTAGNGSMTISAGGSVSSDLGMNVGINLAATGALLVDAGSLTVGNLRIGVGGTGSVTIANGGVVTGTGANGIGVDIGADSSIVIGGGVALFPGTASLTINGGTLNNNGHALSVGAANAKGTLLVEGAGSLISGSALAFANINATGTGVAVATVSGASWTSNGSILIGDTGSGSLDINGAGVVNAGSNGVTIGNQATGKGTLSLESGGSLHAGTVTVANATAPGATGRLSVAGGTVNSAALAVAGGGTVALSSGTLATGNAVIGTGGTGATLTQSGGSITALSVTVGNNSGGSASLAMTGGQITAFSGPVAIGAAGNGSATIGAGASLVAQVGLSLDGGGAAASGTLLVDGGAVNVAGAVSVGGGGNASLTVQGGGNFIANGGIKGIQFQVGSASGGNGVVTVNGGALTGTNEGLSIGNGGNGSMLVENAGTVNTNFNNPGPGVDINTGSGRQASVQVTGVNSVWNLTSSGGQFVVGDNGGGSVSVGAGAVVNAGSNVVDIGNQTGGTGTVAVSGGASFSAASSSSLAAAILVGSGTGSTGALSVSGAGSKVTATGQLTVGSGGAGTLLIASGATVQAGGAVVNKTQGIDVGASGSGSGAIAVSGTQSVLTNTGEFIVGDFGLGSVSVGAGGSLVTSSGGVGGLAGMVIGNTSGATGSQVTVSGAGSQATVVGLLDVGASGTGGLQISAGATMTASSLDAGNVAAAVGQIGVSGAGSKLQITNDATVADDGTGVLSVLSGATFSAASLTIGSQGHSSGALVVSGAGSAVNLTGAINIGTALGTGDLTVGPGAAVHASVVNLQGQVVLEGGLLDPTVSVINHGLGQAGGFGTLAADNIIDEGVIQAGGSGPTQRLLLVNGTIVGGGTLSKNGTPQASAPAGLIQINAGGTVELTGPVLNAASTTILDTLAQTNTYTVTNSVIDVSFADAAGVLLLDDIAGFAGTIASFNAGDSFVITGGTLSGVGVSNGNTLTFSDSGVNAGAGGVDEIIFGSGVTAGQFSIVGGNTVQAVPAVACFAAGTRITTATGSVPVEELRVGDHVLNHRGEAKLIVWIGSRAVDCARHPKPETVRPVRVCAGAFGAGLPRRDLFLSPDHALLIDDVLVPVKYLINGSTIAQTPAEAVTYYHVELPCHDVLLAEGLPAESYLDTSDRSNFSKGGGPVRLHADFSVYAWETTGCAPLVITGAKLTEIRARLATERDRASPGSFARRSRNHVREKRTSC